MTPTNDYRRLSYQPSVEIDRLSQGGQSGLTPVNPTLARRLVRPGVYELYMHANSIVTAWEGARDVSSQYKLLRLRRQWTGQLNGTPPGPMASGYVLDTSISGPRGFGPDYGPRSWIDAPGERTTGRQQRSIRSLQEFIAAVGDPVRERSPVTDFGGMYYIVAVDITPDKYRIWMSLERRLTPDQIQGAMGVPGQLFPSAVIRDGPPEFSSWRYVPQDWQDYAKYSK